MNAQHATDLQDRQHRTTWAPALLSGPTDRRPMSSIDGRQVDAPIGTSHAWRDVIRRATQVAASEATTCLQGESGTGKGGTRPVSVNIRVIAATNRNLDDAVADGEFRADLYYRLNVFDIRIPPLRERRDDIPVLAASFLHEFGDATVELTPQAREALRLHEWPGNVRELRNVIERALITCDGPFIDVEHLCLRARKAVPLSSITDLGILEKAAIQRAMRDADGNKVRAAKQLGISRMQLYTRLRKFGFENA